MKGGTGHTYMNRNGIKHLSYIIKMDDYHGFPCYLYKNIYVKSFEIVNFKSEWK